MVSNLKMQHTILEVLDLYFGVAHRELQIQIFFSTIITWAVRASFH